MFVSPSYYTVNCKIRKKEEEKIRRKKWKRFRFFVRHSFNFGSKQYYAMDYFSQTPELTDTQLTAKQSEGKTVHFKSVILRIHVLYNRL